MGRGRGRNDLSKFCLRGVFGGGPFPHPVLSHPTPGRSGRASPITQQLLSHRVTHIVPPVTQKKAQGPQEGLGADPCPKQRAWFVLFSSQLLGVDEGSGSPRVFPNVGSVREVPGRRRQQQDRPRLEIPPRLAKRTIRCAP